MEGLICWRKPRIIGVMVDGNKPFAEEAMAELLKPFDVQPEDTVVVVNRFGCVEGLPRVAFGHRCRWDYQGNYHYQQVFHDVPPRIAAVSLPIPLLHQKGRRPKPTPRTIPPKSF
jgi:hypothetical protein